VSSSRFFQNTLKYAAGAESDGCWKSHPASVLSASEVAPLTFASLMRGTRKDAFSFHASNWIVRIVSAVIFDFPDVASWTRSVMRWLRAP
jgi:hypothetical protein